MWRTQAIIDLLLGDIGGLADQDPETLGRARRRGIAVVIIDWLAILVLVLFRDRGDSSTALTAGEQTLFTLGLLAIAAHSGYRWAQVHLLRRLQSAVEELEARRDE